MMVSKTELILHQLLINLVVPMGTLVTACQELEYTSLVRFALASALVEEICSKTFSSKFTGTTCLL
jgi:hypothetical protein